MTRRLNENDNVTDLAAADEFVLTADADGEDKNITAPALAAEMRRLEPHDSGTAPVHTIDTPSGDNDVTFDLANGPLQVVEVDHASDIEVTITGGTAGRGSSLRILNSTGATRTVTYAAAHVRLNEPGDVDDGKVAVISVQAYGTGAGDIDVAFAPQVN